ncbi:hypothetical protein E8E13_002417 [Curvularia kusanoi]|uniref:Uncharacterized protein n=1 Tax=Curvularia kusanoi TaxID=90978 RepID=A0A9P4T824_CURKU|nr:hypothetical protein E8E13_002417 [Curvularia kusanoi]
MLPNGWIPEDVVDFFQQFMRYLRWRWIEICDSADEHMSHQRFRQLQEKGENHSLIQYLAEDAQQWDRLRRVLRFEVLSLQDFAKKHFQQYDTFNDTKALEAIESFSDEVGSRLRLLDQTIRDLLQFEFAWVSINEAHKSTSLATSMKRLSWITFVFLPAMFASGLFGMNVDILASNPDWRWYILFVSIILAITILGWLLFKYGQIEQWIERHIGARFSRLGKGRKGQGNVKEDADPRF